MIQIIKISKRNIILSLIMLLYSLYGTTEKFILNDGNIIVGEVLEQNNDNLIVKTSLGTLIIARSNIYKRYTYKHYTSEPRLKITLEYGYGYGAIHSGLGTTLCVGTSVFHVFGNIGNFKSLNEFLYSCGFKLFWGQNRNIFTAGGFGRIDYFEKEYWVLWQKYTTKEPLYGLTALIGYEMKFGLNKNYLILFGVGTSYRFNNPKYSKIVPAFDVSFGVRL